MKERNDAIRPMVAKSVEEGAIDIVLVDLPVRSFGAQGLSDAPA
jgi:hypothetical protein